MYVAKQTAQVEPNGAVRFSFTSNLGPGFYVLQLRMGLSLDGMLGTLIEPRKVEFKAVERPFNPLDVLAPLLAALALAAAYAAAHRFKRVSTLRPPR